MIALVKSWLVGITCAAMIVALAEGLMPRGVVGKIGRLTGGLVLLLAMVQPVLKLDGEALLRSAAQYSNAWNDDGARLEETNEDLMQAIIAERTGAYILDKAATLGIACRVEVAVEGEQGGYPVPTAVTVYGTLTQAQRAALTRQIEADLAIPAQRQTYQGEDVE